MRTSLDPAKRSPFSSAPCTAGLARVRLLAASIVASAICTASAVAAQQPTITRLVDESFGSIPLNPYGNRPALHGGWVACLADYAGQLTSGIFLVKADGSGEVVVAADETTPIPNRPGKTFVVFENPDVFDGTAAFTGGLYTDINDGIYTGDGSSLVTYHDFLADGTPPFGPCIDTHGIAFQLDPSFADTPLFKRPGLPAFALASSGSPAPGGGTFQIFDLPNMPAYAGDVATFCAYIHHPSWPDGDGGVYAYDLTTDTLHVVANPDDVIPGTALQFEFFTTAATDGDSVAFVGNHGNPSFGGKGGLFVAPALSDGQGPITTIALTGEPAPGGGIFGEFGPVAIDGDLVAFGASVWEPTGTHLYVARLDGAGGPPSVTRVLAAGDVLPGGTVASWSFIHRSMDDGRLVIRVGYDSQPNPYFHYGLYLVDFDPAAVAVLEPCSAPAPPDSLVGHAAPKLGATLAIEAGDPTAAATVSSGSLAILVMGVPMSEGCGTVIATLGADDAPGELLIAGTPLVLGTAVWSGPTAPAPFALQVPLDAGLLGHSVAAQAVLLDLVDGDLVLTRGLLLTVGS